MWIQINTITVMGLSKNVSTQFRSEMFVWHWSSYINQMVHLPRLIFVLFFKIIILPIRYNNNYKNIIFSVVRGYIWNHLDTIAENALGIYLGMTTDKTLKISIQTKDKIISFCILIQRKKIHVQFWGFYRFSKNVNPAKLWSITFSHVLTIRIRTIYWFTSNEVITWRYTYESQYIRIFTV